MLEMMSVEQLDDKERHLSEDYAELWRLMCLTKNPKIREQLYELQTSVATEVTAVRKMRNERTGE